MTGGRITGNLDIAKDDPYVNFLNPSGSVGIHCYSNTSDSSAFGIYDQKNQMHFLRYFQDSKETHLVQSKLYVESNLYSTGSLNAGDKISIYTDNEGGTIRLVDKGGKSWEIDGCVDKTLRIFRWEEAGKTSDMIYLHTDGNITSSLGTFLNASNYFNYAAPKEHTHSYLPLSGGTATGNILTNGSTIAVNNGVTLIKNNEGGNIILYSKNGKQWEIDSYNDSELRFFSYYTGSPTGFFKVSYDGSISSSKGTFPTASVSGTTLTINL